MKNNVLKHLGARVRELRQKKGWSQEELAEKSGRHWTYIGGLERGERNATVQVLSDIAEAFGLPIRDLFKRGGGK